MCRGMPKWPPGSNKAPMPLPLSTAYMDHVTMHCAFSKDKGF